MSGNPNAAEYQRLISVIKQNPEEFFAYAKKRYEQGDLRSLAEIMHHCAQLHWPLPPWAAEAFVLSYQKLKGGQLRSWDDVLGRPHPKGRHIANAKLDSREFRVHRRCRELIETESSAIGEALFERVGKEFNLGKTKCEDLYYRYEKIDKNLRDAARAGIIPAKS